MRKRPVFNIICISKCKGFTSIWVADLNSERKNYPMKEFQTIFLISSIWVIRYAKKGQFSILAVIQNIWNLHKFWLQIWFTTQKLPHERISGNFSDFINFGHHAKKGHFSILAVFQNVWDLHKFRLQIWIQTAEITLWKNFGQFFWFHHFWSSCKKRSFLNISCISKCMGFT